MTMTARIAVVALAVGILAGDAVARERGELTAPRPASTQEAGVVAVLVDQATQQPVLVLEGKRDKRQLTMAIGLAEATGIALPLQGVTPPRPLTHDLFLTMFGRLKVTMTRVVVTDFRDDVYYASVFLQTGAGEIVLDSRPSDAIALAVRAKVPVLVEDKVFEKGGAPVVAPRRPHI